MLHENLKQLHGIYHTEKFIWWRNLEQTEVWECLSFGAEILSSSLLSKNIGNSDIQNYKFASCFIRVLELVAHIEEEK
jgi:hypothetical protein